MYGQKPGRQINLLKNVKEYFPTTNGWIVLEKDKTKKLPSDIKEREKVTS